MDKFWESLRGYSFIAPNFVGFAIFTAIPVLGAVLMSFYEGTFSTRIGTGGHWEVDADYVGFKNYRKLLGFQAVRVLGEVRYRRGEGEETVTVISSKSSGDLKQLFAKGGAVDLSCVKSHLYVFCGESTVRKVDRESVVALSPHGGTLYQARDSKFWFYLYNTLYFMLGIPICMAMSLFLAVLMNQKIRGQVIYRTLLFLPSVASGVALFLVWRWIYNPNVGLLNASLELFGLISLSRPDWLGDEALVRPAIIAMGVFTAMGGTNMILFLAGLQGIDPTLYEAAEIDGAGSWDKFRHVTWPQLRPTTYFILTTNLIGGFQMFDQAYVMTNGGPNGATTTVVYYIFQEMFRFQRMGYAAAIAIVLFLIILVATLLNWWVGSRNN